MTFTSLFVTNARKLGTLSIDCVVTENHNSKLKITEYPVEFGASINDHSIIKPKEYTMTGVVSNLPTNFLSFQLPNVLSGTNQTRSSSAFTLLLNIQQTREPITIQTGLRIYTNMILEEITVNQDSVTSGGLYFTAKLKEINIIQNKSVQISPDQYKEGRTRNAAAPTVNRGTVQGTTPPNNDTIARQLLRNYFSSRPSSISLPFEGEFSTFNLETGDGFYLIEDYGYYQCEKNYL